MAWLLTLPTCLPDLRAAGQAATACLVPAIARARGQAGSWSTSAPGTLHICLGTLQVPQPFWPLAASGEAGAGLNEKLGWAGLSIRCL